MSPNTPSEVVARQEHAEATVIRISVRTLDGEQLAVVKETLDREADIASRPLILDLAPVEYLCSAAVGWLLTLRKKLMQRGKPFQPPCRRRALFAFFPDQATALEAVRQGEPDPLLLCGVRPEVMDGFE